jgi:hypothetical protein
MRSSIPASSIPSAIFSAFGNALLIWNEIGAGFYDLQNAESIKFQKISAGNVRIAAGGANKFAVVTKNGTVRCYISQTIVCEC